MGLRLGCARTVQPEFSSQQRYERRHYETRRALGYSARCAMWGHDRCGGKVGKARKPEDYVRCTCECHPPDMVPLVTRSTGQHHEHKFDWVPFRCERCGQNRLKLASCCEQWAAVCIRCE
jgi:hypothetical protein